jgi:hypothetical protein
MNDNGRYMFEHYGGTWINDTPEIRQAIKNQMRQWAPFSDSDPSDGIAYAIQTFWAPDKKISIYVFGDEFSGGSVENVVRQVETVNRPTKDGQLLVRIHAVGFPFLFEPGRQAADTSRRFAQLMRVLCDRNGGTFVALSDPNS